MITEVLFERSNLSAPGLGPLVIPPYIEVFAGGASGVFELIVVDVRSSTPLAMSVTSLGALSPGQSLVVHEGVWPSGAVEGVVGVGARRVAVDSMRLLEVFGASRSLLLFDGPTGLGVGNQFPDDPGALPANLIGSLNYRVDPTGVLASFPIDPTEGVVEADRTEALRRRFVDGYVETVAGIDVGRPFVSGGGLFINPFATDDGGGGGETPGPWNLTLDPGFANRPGAPVAPVPEPGVPVCWMVVGCWLFGRHPVRKS
jgi:hypothetical protein